MGVGFESNLPVGVVFFYGFKHIVEVVFRALIEAVVFDLVRVRCGICPNKFYSVVASTQFGVHVSVAVVVVCYVLGAAEETWSCVI